MQAADDKRGRGVRGAVAALALLAVMMPTAFSQGSSGDREPARAGYDWIVGLEPETLNYRVSLLGQPQTRTFFVYCTSGSMGFHVSLIEGDPDGEFTWDPHYFIIGAGDTVTVTVTYTPVDAGDDEARFEVYREMGSGLWLTSDEVTCLAEGPGTPRAWYVSPTGSNGNPGTPAAPLATIQHALDLAADADSVLLFPGTYGGAGNRDLDCLGRSVVVRSLDGDASTCLIDCGGSSEAWHRAFDFHGGETGATRLEDLSLTNGYHENGGAILCRLGSSPNLEGCVLADNWSEFDGAALFCQEASSPSLVDCVLRENIARDDGGALACRDASNVRLTGCTLSLNSSADAGGALYVYNASPVLADCTLHANSAAGYGSALSVRGGAVATLQNTIIAFHVQTTPVQCAGGTAALACCDIYGNEYGNWTDCIAGQLGVNGNVEVDPLFCDCSEGDLTLRSDSPCAAANNPGCGQIGAHGVGCEADVLGVYTTHDGAGADHLTVAPGTPFPIYLTLADASRDEGLAAWEVKLTVSANVEVLSWSYEGSGLTMGGFPGNFMIAYTTVMPWQPVIWLATLQAVVTDDDPGYIYLAPHEPSSISPPAPCYIPWGNPATLVPMAIASGAPTTPVFVINPRTSHTYLVRADGTGDYPNIQAAINACVDGDVVELADGTFTGAGNRDLDTQGKAITIRSASGLSGSAIIDCQGLGRAFSFQNDEGPSTVVQGLTIENGHATTEGGAIACGSFPTSSAAPTIRGCVFRDNVSEGNGGAIWAEYISHVTIEDCVFYGNRAYRYGGAYGNDFYSEPTLRGCTFFDNACEGHPDSDGGGVFSSSYTLTIDACIIWGNRAVMGDQIGLQNSTALTMTCSDVQGGSSGIHVEPGCTLNYGAGNIDEFPLFCGTTTYDLTLNAASPCLPGHNSCGVLMGALGSGCSGMTAAPPADIPAVFILEQNAPNPFNPATTITFGLPRPGRVRLSIFDALGRRVRTLLDEERPAGITSIRWDGNGDGGAPVASGAYFYRLQTGSYEETKRMMLVR